MSAASRTIDGKGREETERAVIGCIAMNGERCTGIAVESGVATDWFAQRQCRAAWEAAAEMFATAKPMTIVTLDIRIRELAAGEHDAAFLDRCADAAITEAHFEYALDCLRMHVLCDREIATAREQIADAENADPQQIHERIAGWQKRWAELTGSAPRSQTVAQAAVEWIERVATPRQDRAGLVHWPLPVLDDTLNPLTDELVYICALESVGKTALALQMAVFNARAGVRVAIRSLESSVARIAPRMIAHMGCLDRMRMDRGHAQPEEFADARAAASELARLPIVIHDGGADVAQLRAWAISEKAKGAGLLIVDNLRHVRRKDGRDKSTAEQFSQLSAAIKHIRDDVQIPLVMLHHLTTDDVSWSKDIRKDADVLMFLLDDKDHSIPPGPENDWTGKWVIEAKIEKHRDGEKGWSKLLLFDKTCQTYRAYLEMPESADGRDLL